MNSFFKQHNFESDTHRLKIGNDGDGNLKNPTSEPDEVGELNSNGDGECLRVYGTNGQPSRRGGEGVRKGL
jgi:hypothetical protein